MKRIGRILREGADDKMAVFIFYSWDSEEHTKWVEQLAERLEKDDIEVNIDKWGLQLGQQLTQFMETSIRESDYVLIVCTPAYKKKSDDRRNGVGYEGNIISAELFYKNNYLKFIPVLRSGTWEEAAPTSQLGSYYVDLREGNRKYENEYVKLRNTLRGIPPKRPAGSHGSAGWDDIKLSRVTEYLLGRALFGPYGIIYTDGYFINESEIKEILDRLKICTRNGGWATLLYKSDIDRIIDDHTWKNGDIEYSYSAAERVEIMVRCAKSIKYRLAQYAGKDHIQYNIFYNGDIGFKYE